MRTKALLTILGGISTGVLLGSLVFGQSLVANQFAEQELPPTVGSPVKDFTLADLHGNTLNLTDLRGKPVILNFWATWCPPCKEEFPLLEETAKKYNDQLHVIAVNYAETQDVVESYVDDHNITIPIVLDKSGLISDIYFVHNYPVTFFIDEDGLLRAQHVGQLTQDVVNRYITLIGIKN